MELWELPTPWIKDRLALFHRQRTTTRRFGPEHELAHIEHQIRTLQAELTHRINEEESPTTGP